MTSKCSVKINERLPLVYKRLKVSRQLTIMQQGQVEDKKEDKYDYLVFNSTNIKTKCCTPCPNVQVLPDHPPPHTHMHIHTSPTIMLNGSISEQQ